MNRSLLNQRYVPLRKIAAGGMGEIYLARQTGMAGFQRQVVLKRIHRRLGDNPRAVEMFLNEARLAASLSHPNIVQIYDVGEEDGAYFIVMERITGAGLRELAETATRKGQMIPMELSITIIAQVLEGLRYAHNFRDETGRPLRIVHRDVGPTNILISYDGAVKLLDFGIARAEDQLRQDSGTAPGKFAYMAPEGVVGEPVDARSDLFGVGVLLYELTVGQRLFRAASFEAMRRVVDDPIPPPTFARAGYPVDLEILVMRALERDPADRFVSAEEMLEELEQFAFDNGMRLSRLRLGRFVSRVMGVRGAAISHPGEGEADLAPEDLDFDKGLFGEGKPGTVPSGEGAGEGRESSALEAIKQANEAIAELVAAADQLQSGGGAAIEDEEGATMELRPAAQAQLRAHTVPAEPEPKDGSALIVTDDLVEEVSDLEEEEPEILDGPPPGERAKEEVTRRYPVNEPDQQDQQETVVVETIVDEDVVEEPVVDEPFGEEPGASEELQLALADISKELEVATAAATLSDRERRRRLEAIVQRAPAGSEELLDPLLGPKAPGTEIAEEAAPDPAEPQPELEEDELERVDGTGRRPLDELELADRATPPEDERHDQEEPDLEEDDGLDDRTIELGEESLEVVEELAATPPELPDLAVDDGLDDDTIPEAPAPPPESASPAPASVSQVKVVTRTPPAEEHASRPGRRRAARRRGNAPAKRRVGRRSQRSSASRTSRGCRRPAKMRRR